MNPRWLLTLFLTFTLLINCRLLQSQTTCFDIVGYFPSWNGWASDIDYGKYTHIIYAFGIPNNDGSIDPIDNATKLSDLVTRGHAKNVKILLSIGGWLDSSPDNTPFETLSTSPAAIKKFAQSCADLITTYNLDGIDIDWEYPTTKAKWDSVVVALDSKIHGMGKLLTGAVAENAYYGDHYDNVGVLDLVNIMCYGTYNDASNAMTYWTGRGVPQEKRMLGVPFYGNDNNTDEHVQKATLAKTTAGGIMIWEISSPGDITSIFNTLGSLCNRVTTEVAEKMSINPFRVYPTLTSDRVIIENNLHCDAQLSVYSMDTRNLRNEKLLSGTNIIDVSDFQPGIYIFTITHDATSVVLKICKQ